MTVLPTEAQVISIQICPGHRQPMQTLQIATATQDYGLEHDIHAHSNASRQVLLMPLEVIQKLGIQVGDVKENITTQGIDLMNLHPGIRLQVGASELEIIKVCEPCSRMDEIRSGLREELEGQRGMLARVSRSGEIKVGDAIRVLD